MSWSGWFDIGSPPGGFRGGPATISRNKDVCNVYVRGVDDKLWQRAYYNGRWHPWGRHDDGVLASKPALGSMGRDHEHVFVRGTDGNVYQKYWQAAGGWKGWFNIGAPPGGFIGAPATISRNKDVCNVYVRGTDDKLWQRAYYNGQWHPWGRHDDGVLASEPTLGSMGPDHEHVFVRGTDGKVYQKYWTAQGGWKGWFDIGAPSGGYVGAPATISRNKDVCNVYVRGTDDKLWQRAYYNGQWHAWGRHEDGVLASEPALGSMGADHEHVFVRGTDGNVYQKYWQATAQPVGEVSFPVSECVYGWTARYHQSGTHITVRIQLNPDAGITGATMDALRTTWRNGIIATWSNQFHCKAPNGGRQAVTFDVQWVTSNAHHVVRVRPGPERSNMGTWDTNDTANVAAHEFGHMLGHPDEYADATCPSRNPVSTGSVMDDNTEPFARHYNRICTFHGSGHGPVAAGAPEPAEAPETGGTSMELIDNLTPRARDAVLKRLRAVADGDAAPSEGGEPHVSFEVTGGAPGERYAYSLDVQADGSAARSVIDELGGGLAPGESDSGGSVPQGLAADVFAAAREIGLFDDEAPALPGEQIEILPDSLVAILTVRDGDAVRRVVVPVMESDAAADGTTPGATEVPLDTPVLLPTESVDRLAPVLAALGKVESAL
ncbi:hypothetical protein QL996_13810 [Planococcus sp. APC 4015]|nr:hypothetical protein [Planococcus sp. APC 4015]